MLCRRKEFKRCITVDPRYWNKESEQNMHMRLCVEYLAFSEAGRSAVIRHLLKDEINHIFSTTYIIIVVYMEIAMSPSLGFLSDSSSPSPSFRLVLCPQLHLLTCSQPVQERTLWNVPAVAFKDFLSWCCGSEEHKHTCRITVLALTTWHWFYLDLS